MNRRAPKLQLPVNQRNRLDGLLIERGFSNYRGFADWLSEQPPPGTDLAPPRHGEAVERRIDQVRIATEQAKAIEEAAGDDGHSIAFATLVQCQAMLHRIALATEDGDAKMACQQARALADLTRAGISLRRERQLERAETMKAVGRTLAFAADRAEASDDASEVLRRVRQEIYGIFDDG